MIEQKFIKSPLNYTGGKYKILNILFSYFPKKINTFYDLFAGGFSVGININANKIIYNDHLKYLSEMFIFFKNNEIDFIFDYINSKIKEFDLNDENKEGYLALRDEYNKNKYILDLFILSCYCFNHQIRFNKKLEFNTPFGKNRSKFNHLTKQKLLNFIITLKKKKIDFYSNDFSFIRNMNLQKNDLIYLDPPYLISKATYNDGYRGFKNWTKKEDLELFNLMDEINSKGIKFLLSNVLTHKGLKNEELINWSKKYKVIEINKDYRNCNYQLKQKENKTREVLILNY